jgi:hypothetical protein
MPESISQLFNKTILSLTGISTFLSNIYAWLTSNVATKSDVSTATQNGATKTDLNTSTNTIVTAITNKPVTQIGPIMDVLGDFNAGNGTIQDQIADVGTAVGQIEFDKTGLATESGTTSAVTAAAGSVINALPKDYAQRGENSGATNSAILNALRDDSGNTVVDILTDETSGLSAISNAVSGLPEVMKNMYAAHFEQNEDGEDTYTMVMPLTAIVSETGEAITINI